MTGYDFHVHQHAHNMDRKEHVNWTVYPMIPLLCISCKSRMESPDQDEICQLSHCTLFHKGVVLLTLLIFLGASGNYHIQAYFAFIQHDRSPEIAYSPEVFFKTNLMSKLASKIPD